MIVGVALGYVACPRAFIALGCGRMGRLRFAAVRAIAAARTVCVCVAGLAVR